MHATSPAVKHRSTRLTILWVVIKRDEALGSRLA